MAVNVIYRLGQLILLIVNLRTNLFSKNLKKSKQKFEDEDIEKVLVELFEKNKAAEIDDTYDGTYVKMTPPCPPPITPPRRPPPLPPMRRPPPPLFRTKLKPIYEDPLPTKESIYDTINVSKRRIPTESTGRPIPTKRTGAIPKRRSKPTESTGRPIPTKRTGAIFKRRSEQIEIGMGEKSFFVGQSDESSVDQTETEALLTSKQQDEMKKSLSQGSKEELEDSKSEEECTKVAAASKLGGMKETVETKGTFKKKKKKMDEIELKKIRSASQTETVASTVASFAQWDEMEEIDLDDEKVEDEKVENTFLFRMIKNQRFKNIFKKCRHCNNVKCNCVSK